MAPGGVPWSPLAAEHGREGGSDDTVAMGLLCLWKRFERVPLYEAPCSPVNSSSTAVCSEFESLSGLCLRNTRTHNVNIFSQQLLKQEPWTKARLGARANATASSQAAGCMVLNYCWVLQYNASRPVARVRCNTRLASL